MDYLKGLEVKEWLQYNAQLQTKKNALRKMLKERGVLKKGATNTYDKYSYFSEAQYKELFTGLFSSCGLELKFDELEYITFEGSEKQANGRMPRLMFYLFDTDTGFYETTTITGEGIDKGDKAGYKAYTGALKYYLADTFMVATGDDPEKDSPEQKMNNKKRPATKEQLAYIIDNATKEQIDNTISFYKIDALEKLTREQADKLIMRINKLKMEEKGQPQ